MPSQPQQDLSQTPDTSIAVPLSGNADTTSTDTNQTSNTPATKKRKTTSEVWLHFDKDGKEDLKAICKYCKSPLSGKSGSGTQHLWRHLERCKTYQSSNRSSKQSLLVVSKGSKEMTSWQFSEQKSRALLSKMVAAHGYPFRLVEHKYFKLFVASLHPHFKLRSCFTVKEDCMALFQSMKTDLLKEIIQANRLALTTDLWSSRDSNGYMVITAHFIDASWNLIKHVISFKELPSPHTGSAIADRLVQSLVEWKSISKCAFMTVDNASSNNSAITRFKMIVSNRTQTGLEAGGMFFHVRCAAHIINLIVKDGLSVILEAVQKLRRSVKYIKISQARCQLFKASMKSANISLNFLPSKDVATRWNSTYLMIQSGLPFKMAFENLASMDTNYHDCPSPEEWLQLSTMKDFLGIFYKSTVDLSASKYPTSHLIFKTMKNIERHLLLGQTSSSKHIASIVEPMLSKFYKYWSDMKVFAAIALVFDPRSKLSYVEFKLRERAEDQEVATCEIENIRKALYSWYMEYVKAAEDATIKPSVVSKKATNNEIVCLDEDEDSILFKEHLAKTKGLGSSAPTVELDLYLKEHNTEVPPTVHFEILEWWKVNSLRFPTLSQLAQTILMIPATSVASESAFSASGRVLNDFRTSLNPDTLEALICTQDWLNDSDQVDEVDQPEESI
ncbi:hypothetical protein PGT21_050144 [Puccinia graminis f. sp. tritici]|uniref:BED-type domain-containing protein n=1 Tax=Puccinia graminis f. sp. tritici TaxID=56615 RepID=A0A5B0PX05_PUCGR|nr:hypothetical protein PGT21_050144 [Puccinia graminis f. sp. tritici]